MVDIKKHYDTIDKTLRWLNKVYPEDVFDGSSGDSGVERIIDIKKGLKNLKSDLEDIIW